MALCEKMHIFREPFMTSINIKDLSFQEKLSITWSFVWRGFFITMLSSLLGAFAGFIVGFVLTLLQIPAGVIAVMAGLIGFSVGMFSIYVYVQWLLAAKLGAFKLILTRAEPVAQ